MVSRFVPSGPVKQDGICLLPPPTHYRIMPPQPPRSEAYHNSTGSYVPQTQGPSQGPGLRNIATTGPPNQSSTPPNTDLKVTNIQGQLPQMFGLNPVRAPPGQPFFTSRTGGGPPTQGSRMPNQQHRGQAPIYQSQYVVQPVYLPPQSVYFNQRPPNNLMAPHQSFAQPVFQQSFSGFPQFSSTVSTSVPYQAMYGVFPPQSAPLSLTRTTPTPVTAAPPNAPTGSLQNQPILTQAAAAPATYAKNKQRRLNAIPIIDPNTGQDRLDEIFDPENASHPPTGESSARQTPQPPNDKEIQAAFAKQVAQAISEDKHNTNVEQPPSLHAPSPTEQFPSPLVSTQPLNTSRFDVAHSDLHYNAKEFVLTTASLPSKESTPIVSANSDAAEITLNKKEVESPAKTRKQGHREPKPEIPKEFQPKETDCDNNISSIVKEESVPVPQMTVVNTQPPIVEPSSPIIKETAKENNDKKGAKKPVVSEPKSSEIEHHSPAPVPEVASQNNGKSKNNRNKNVHNQNQNGKPQPPQPQQAPPQASPAVAVPPPQPPKPNNRSNKSKELNLKGANKEGTDMDAFNDNGTKTEINANVLPQPDVKTVSNDVTNANSISQPIPPTVVPPTLETDKVISETRRKDSNENVTTIKSEPVVANNIPSSVTATAAPVAPKPVTKPFDVTSIVKDPTPKTVIPPFSIPDNRDETDKAVPNDNVVLSKNDVNSKTSLENSRAIVYKPGQWSPDRPDGNKVYDKEFLMKLKSVPASLQKPDNIPESVLLDERNRQVGGHLSVGGRTDYTNPPFNNYGGKSGSRSGTLTKRNSQSKMGSRGGDKAPGKTKIISISIRGDIKLHESENAWKPARFIKGEGMTDEEKKTEVLYKKVRSVLNKLTPQKFETLVNQVRELQIDTKERLQGVIDLVFEKAIDEPNFSSAYANMCKEIQNMQVSITGTAGDDKKLAFRTLLVMRCQMEFEKQSVDESERNNKLKEIEECTDAEKKKELRFDLEEYDRRVRMKSVGCIRFIGELFIQQMLTASIMKRCLQTLLDNKDEESLECLCKLLTTVGKELESKSNDLASIFDEMKKITEGKRQKVSSRIRFMLQDVGDLRDSKWVPRRGDTNPKTIDQIQKEAETEHLNIQVMNMTQPRKDDRGGGPRGSSGGSSRQKGLDDGWNSVGSKSNRQSFSFQADKVRVMRLPQADEPLGGSNLFSNWGKGANVKTVPLNPSPNMYAALENIDMDKRLLINQRPYAPKGPSIERNQYKLYDGRDSRSGSQHRDSSTPMRTTGPPPSSASMAPPNLAPQPTSTLIQAKSQSYQPEPAPASAVEPLTEEYIERRIRNSLEEFIAGSCTTKEYFEDVASTLPANEYSKIVYESYNYVLEKSQIFRLKTSELFAVLLRDKHITEEDFLKGFNELLSLWEDLVIDIPTIWQYFAEDLIALVCEDVLSFSTLRKLLDNLIECNAAKKLLKSLFALVVKEKGPNFLQNAWQKASLQLSNFMPAADVKPFVQENNLEFLLGGDSPVCEGSMSYDVIQSKLSEFLQAKTPFDDIVNWISANVGGSVKENRFIRTLATAIFETSISKNKLQPEILASHSKLIQKYVDANANYELQCLYALQSLVHKLEHPQGLLLAICDKLYEDSTFSQESFIGWEKSTEPSEQEGKGVALKQLTSFFTQLKENEDDEEYSSNSEDA
ncbi:eukaryotic translation initiation factor 4 gamma 3-like isoform X2 [Euwallacea similis]|uniref:eukaryotic translation initiation factor 4 gamma 3-like isoform X2 n=1 Tax=Euwallacea similis TaxID=1736056 RepID=UPI003450E9E8